ncbi:G-type lectin S-receptor-like serine/threonine-protein kinase CES101 [Rutidosis leptorrhynchoides]|uniref:G-type lectin S-receptor-like serine/threonine-protein kinase CES101 n=1 Tax=Rutidosis leptorrhynchoides TaxID=125765 RepID=UPI003A9A39F4
MMKISWLTLSWLLLLFGLSSEATEFKVLKAGQELRNFHSLVSPNQIYTLSFFYPDSSTTTRYFGIQFSKPRLTKSVWIANRVNPFSDSSGIFYITDEGDMVLSDNSSGLNITLNTVKPLSSQSGEQIVWQSFDEPTDAFLRGMKVGLFGLKTKEPSKKFLNSWLSPEVASSGAFALGIDDDDLYQLVIWKRVEVYWHSGSLDGKNLKNLQSFPYPHLEFKYSSNDNESYFTFLGIDSQSYYGNSSFIQLNSSGEICVNNAEIDSYQLIDNLQLCDDEDDNISEGCIPAQPSKCTGGD